MINLDKEFVVNGWILRAHPCFLTEYHQLIQEVENLKIKNEINYQKKNATKKLAAIEKLIFEIIPQDPSLNIYRQGATLGSQYKHWFRAKFFQQYRLFFRYDQQEKIIIYGWVNNDESKRSYNSKTDAYYLFSKMLNNGNPPDNWNDLLKKSKSLDLFK